MVSSRLATSRLTVIRTLNTCALGQYSFSCVDCMPTSIACTLNGGSDHWRWGECVVRKEQISFARQTRNDYEIINTRMRAAHKCDAEKPTRDRERDATIAGTVYTTDWIFRRHKQHAHAHRSVFVCSADTFKIFPRVLVRIGFGRYHEMKRTECATWTRNSRHRRRRCRSHRRWLWWTHRNKRVLSVLPFAVDTGRVEMHCNSIVLCVCVCDSRLSHVNCVACPTNVRGMTIRRVASAFSMPNIERVTQKCAEPTSRARDIHALQLQGIFPLNTGIPQTCHFGWTDECQMGARGLLVTHACALDWYFWSI